MTPLNFDLVKADVARFSKKKLPPMIFFIHLDLKIVKII